MEKLTAFIRNPYGIAYDQKSKALTLTGVESTGREVAVQVDPEATRALFDLVLAAAKAGVALGEEAPPRSVQ